ncbi:MAG: M48 family metallopeptidase [Betaproteobacteria bacterium]|nr:M48 family metallopeptidase [Betaproteobacteria bacterium]MCL2885664.1 M48 family metallopeptidase [Betaproteobacteria bacterium]
MNRADFVHLVLLSEQASAGNSRAYRRSVAVFATLGYLWVFACLALAVGIIVWVTGIWVQGGRLRFGQVYPLLFALGLLWVTLRALWVRLDEPDGVELKREDAPALFDALERIRRKINGPPVHRVFLDGEFNASICQLPRYGFFGGSINYLSIGLPLLMALDRRRVMTVLAHEYGHLRGDHGKLSAWIYRTRLSWLRLDASFEQDEGLMAFASQAFFRWYFPRFAAKTFALARQDEYEADRIAGWLLGTHETGAALKEIEIKDAWYAQRFWPEHWGRAVDEQLPVGPFASMASKLCAPVEDDFARAALRGALRSVGSIDDTHPVLRDRLEALNETSAMPRWSTQWALALLADAPKWIAHFDAKWRREHASDWKQHHAYLTRIRERVTALAASANRNNADEMVEWANGARRLDANADVRSLYERALAITPSHAGALRGLVQVLPAHDREARLTILERLHETSDASQWWAAKTALSLLEDSDAGACDERVLRLWRERAKTAEAAEQRTWEEITATPYFSQIARHDLNDSELGELRSDFVRYSAVTRAWVVRKNLREFPWRRAYVVFLELPRLADDECWNLCRELEQTLSLPGAALVLWAGDSPTLAEIEQRAFEPVWKRVTAG